MYPYETLDNIPDEIWDIVDAFFNYDENWNKGSIDSHSTINIAFIFIIPHT